MADVKISDISLTVVYEADSVFPDNMYGMEIPIVVIMDISDNVPSDQIDKTITIKIGDNEFLASEIETWAGMIKKAQDMAKTFN